MKKYKVLVLHDTPTGPIHWAYSRRSSAMVRYAAPDMEITRASTGEARDWDLRKFGCVFLLDYSQVNVWKTRCAAAGIPLLCSMNKDGRSRHEEWKRVLKYADFTIVSNLHRYTCDGIQPRTCHLPNGVCTETFQCKTPQLERENKCVWTGGLGPAKRKNFSTVIEKLRVPLDSLGIQHSFRPVTEICPEQVMNTDTLVDWYNSASIWLCASETEGGPSCLLESMSCGCIPVMTDVGNATELIEHDVSGLIVPTPDPALFIEAIKYASEHRERLSAAALESIKGWSYGPPGDRAQYFYQLFRRLIDDGPNSVEPFSYATKHWSEI